MDIYIFADMEGISGISGSDFVRQDGYFYDLGRKYYTLDINACVDACFKAGATNVIVRDGHSSGNHAIWSEVDSRADLIQGHAGKKRFPGIEGCSAMILLGYHAMAGTPGALLEHTFSSAWVQNMWVNGRAAGEVAIDAAIAAEYNVPVIMVSGDDKVCLEAKQWLPGVVTCQVKEGITCQGTRMLSLPKAHALIQEKTIEAIGRLGGMPLLELEKPVKFRVEYIERGEPKTGYSIELIDGRTFEITDDSMEKAFFKS